MKKTSLLPKDQAVDLDLRVRTTLDSGAVQIEYVLNSPNGAVGFFHEEISGPRIHGNIESALGDLLDQVTQLSSGLDPDGQPLLPSEVSRRLDSIGRSLFDLLFSPALRSAYRIFRESVRTVRITSDEAWIPWELVKPFDPDFDDEFLCIRFELTRWLAGTVVPPRSILVQKVAFFGSRDVSGLPGLMAERELVAAIAEASESVEDLSPKVSTLRSVQHLLENGGIGLLHFVTPGSGVNNESRLLLEDGTSLRASDLFGPLQLQLRRDRPLVFLNFSLGSKSDYSHTGAWANHWVKNCEAGAFLAPLWSIRDSTAYKFASSFYRNLVEGRTLGEATRMARLTLRTEFPHDPGYLAYSIYGDPNTRLVLVVIANSNSGHTEPNTESPDSEIKNDRLIVKSIEFEPEHYQAGLNILSYFNTVVCRKYPDKKIKVRIEQEGMLVRMIIETPEGMQEELEETLDDYGAVIQGRKHPNELLANEFEVAELRHQLRLAHVQLESQRELYALVQNHGSSRIESLESEVRWLRSHVGDVLKLSDRNISTVERMLDGILEVSSQTNSQVLAALESLKSALEDGAESLDVEAVREALSTVRAHDRSLFESIRSGLEELVLKGSISGAAGNLLFELLKSSF